MYTSHLPWVCHSVLNDIYHLSVFRERRDRVRQKHRDREKPYKTVFSKGWNTFLLVTS